MGSQATLLRAVSPAPRLEVGEVAELSRGGTLLLVAVGLILGASPAVSGLYDISVWGPADLVTLVLVIAVLAGRQVVLSGRSWAFVGTLAAIAAWCWISGGWAQSAPDASQTAAMWTFYAALVFLALTLIRGDRERKLLLGSAALAGAVVAAVLLVELAVGSGHGLFVGGRLQSPVGYINGQAAAMLLLFWPAVAVAESPGPPALRGCAAGAAVLGLGLTLLTESRGAFLALVLTALVLVVCAPGRTRRAWTLLVIGSGFAAAAPTLSHLYSNSTADGYQLYASQIHQAARVLILAGTGTAAAWTGVSFAELRLPAERRRVAGRVLSGTLVVVIAAGVLGGLVLIGNPVHFASRQVHSFASLAPVGTGDRLLNAESNRSDYWRVALKEFHEHPLGGLGAGNYTTDYFKLRQTSEDVENPHSIELQMLSELGIVGFLLLVGFVGLVLSVGWSALRRAPGRISTPVAVAALGTFLGWFLQTSVDWIHLIPGLTGVALVSAAALFPAARPLRSTDRHRLFKIGPLIAVCVLAAAMTARITIAQDDLSSAQKIVSKNPVRAYDLARKAWSYEPGLLPALYVEANAYAQQDDYRDARATLLYAQRLEPANFIPPTLLGELAQARGMSGVAHGEFRRAAQLNPLNATVQADLLATAAA